MDWYLKCMRQYADFSGRARRKEYFMFALMYALFSTVLIAAITLGGVLLRDDTSFSLGVGFIYLFVFAHIIPAFAVQARRLHDVGKSGWFSLVSLIPYVGWIIVLFFTIQKGDSGPNQYGSDPFVQQ